MAENESINNPQFFEGVEKLLEIWFTPSNKNADLRKIPRYVVSYQFMKFVKIPRYVTKNREKNKKQCTSYKYRIFSYAIPLFFVLAFLLKKKKSKKLSFVLIFSSTIGLNMDDSKKMLSVKIKQSENAHLAAMYNKITCITCIVDVYLCPCEGEIIT